MADKWITLCKRTNDPKLAWIERQLATRGITSRRSGHSWHAPILLVQEKDQDAAWNFLAEPFDGENNNQTVDDVDDNDPTFDDN